MGFFAVSGCSGCLCLRGGKNLGSGGWGLLFSSIWSRCRCGLFRGFGLVNGDVSHAQGVAFIVGFFTAAGGVSLSHLANAGEHHGFRTPGSRGGIGLAGGF